ncbi:MAG: GTPase HflX [Gloeomargaritaceae cyanobacterium C42_A2020_066]|nr:GTPase HflX [Gloeomargaritaceae cyanobacterium C42_A2020_066]
MGRRAVAGHPQGLKPNLRQQVQRLYHCRFPVDALITSDLAQRLVGVARGLGRPVSVYVNRRGQVIQVGIGSPQITQLSPERLPRQAAGRLSGIRCITTQTGWEIPPTADLVTLARQRWDALVTLVAPQNHGFMGGYVAHVGAQPEAPWWVSTPLSGAALCELSFLQGLATWEADLAAAETEALLQPDPQRVVLVAVFTGETATTEDRCLQELALLATSAGATVVGQVIQRRAPRGGRVVGAGKVQEIRLLAQAQAAGRVIVEGELTPAQVRGLEGELGVVVQDRTELILSIFAQRARSRAGQLQVERAKLEYQMARLTGQGRALSRLGGGIGTRGPGETQLEQNRRTLTQRIAHLERQVELLRDQRDRQRSQRQRQQIPTLALVGYTNAGKSTLLNALTHAAVSTSPQVFATLDPTSRRIGLPDPQTGEVHTAVLTDTVGFIENLPPPLLRAFRATLEEVTEADALLHVVDLSHPDWPHQVATVTALLAAMTPAVGPMLVVGNKIDALNAEQLAQAQAALPQAVLISAQESRGLDQLRPAVLALIQALAS